MLVNGLQKTQLEQKLVGYFRRNRVLHRLREFRGSERKEIISLQKTSRQRRIEVLRAWKNASRKRFKAVDDSENVCLQAIWYEIKGQHKALCLAKRTCRNRRRMRKVTVRSSGKLLNSWETCLSSHGQALSTFLLSGGVVVISRTYNLLIPTIVSCRDWGECYLLPLQLPWATIS